MAPILLYQAGYQAVMTVSISFQFHFEEDKQGHEYRKEAYRQKSFTISERQTGPRVSPAWACAVEPTAALCTSQSMPAGPQYSQ